jgi:hypothetical protein|eukprot:COSAG01_NODE_870_length_13032_cov_8.365654_5_plen_100_part_00
MLTDSRGVLCNLLGSGFWVHSVGERRRLEQDEAKMRELLSPDAVASPTPEHMAKIARCRRWLEAKAKLCNPRLLCVGPGPPLLLCNPACSHAFVETTQQ